MRKSEMSFSLLIFLLFCLSCSNSGEVNKKIRGRWYSESSGIYLEITSDEYIIKNDSPIPEDYKLIGDSLIVKGFEASLFPWKYQDTLRIVKLTSDSLILSSSDSYKVFYKR